jgi:hypothetical protein
MTDLNPDTPDKPIVVPASPGGDQAATLGRDVIIIMSALPALIAVLGTHDVKQIVDFLSGTGFAPALGVLSAAAVLAWRQWNARRKNADLNVLEKHVDDSVATTKWRRSR